MNMNQWVLGYLKQRCAVSKLTPFCLEDQGLP